MKVRITYVLLAVTFFAVSSLSAQKFGYLNSAQLLSELPDVKTADQQLQTYQEELIAKGEGMVKAFQEKFTKYQGEAQTGEFSPVQLQQKETELANEQQAIQQYQVEVENKLLKKREELYAPILDRVKQILTTIGKEEGYTMIFDTSSGGLLHMNPGDDLMATVKAKLGL